LKEQELDTGYLVFDKLKATEQRKRLNTIFGDGAN
jgi:hypothetical protein